LTVLVYDWWVRELAIAPTGRVQLGIESHPHRVHHFVFDPLFVPLAVREDHLPKPHAGRITLDSYSG